MSEYRITGFKRRVPFSEISNCKRVTKNYNAEDAMQAHEKARKEGIDVYDIELINRKGTFKNNALGILR